MASYTDGWERTKENSFFKISSKYRVEEAGMFRGLDSGSSG